MNANTFYEILNGSWSIALSFVVVFLLIYLYGIARTISLRTFLFNQTLPEQFAIAILVADFGHGVVRGGTWLWRTWGAGPMPGWLGGVIISGALIGTAGILCKMRVISVARFGHWPWIVCTLTMLAFLAYQLS